MEERLIRVSNYARLRGVSVTYIYRLIKQRKLKSRTIDGVVFVIKED